jgi:hypothetical protein
MPARRRRLAAMATLRAWAHVLDQTAMLWLPVLMAVGVAAGLAWLFAWRPPTPPASRPPTSGTGG